MLYFGFEYIMIYEYICICIEDNLNFNVVELGWNIINLLYS